MPILDISRTLTASLAVWPGDPPFAMQMVASRRAGAAVNLSALALSAHTGTHVDAPFHMSDDYDRALTQARARDLPHQLHVFECVGAYRGRPGPVR